MADASSDAWETQYGRIKIRLQEREQGGFTFQFINKPSGEILATEYTLETDREKANNQAMNRAGELLAPKAGQNP